MARRKRQFVKLDYELLENPQWLNLRKSSQLVYIYLKKSRNKYIKGRGTINRTNKFIEYSPSDCPLVKRTAFKESIKELRIAGFIKLIKAGSFKPKTKTVYALSNRWMRPKNDPI